MNTEHHSPSPLDIWKDILMGTFDELFVCGPCGSVVWGNCPKHRQNSFYPGGAQFYMRQSGACYELCHCCGAFPIKNVNGSYKRFCSECEDEVRLLNARLGRCAVPTGYPTRHNTHLRSQAPPGCRGPFYYMYIAINWPFEGLDSSQERLCHAESAAYL